MSNVVHVDLPATSYDVVIEPGLLTSAGGCLRGLSSASRIAIISDSVVSKLYGSQLTSTAESADFSVYNYSFSADEQHKTIESVSAIYDALLEQGYDRKCLIVAFGGGVAGDLVGFVAATFLRGVPFVQFPTTLLAMVDASVGGKVAYNHRLGKNLIGAFYQPKAVLIDPIVLNSLPKREFNSGLAECIKHGLIGSADLYEWTRTHMGQILSQDQETLCELIAKNVAFKTSIVCQDEKEQGKRALLNLGHTFAHAVETGTGYGTFLHGEAVALGTCAAFQLAQFSGRCSESDVASVKETFASAELPVQAELPDTETLMKIMLSDKKVQDGKLRLIVPTGIGSSTIEDSIPKEQIAQAWDSIRS